MNELVEGSVSFFFFSCDGYMSSSWDRVWDEEGVESFWKGELRLSWFFSWLINLFFFFSSSSSSWNCLTMRNVIIIFIHYVHGLDGGYCGYMKYKKYILVNIYVSKIKRGKKKRKKSFGLIFHLGAVACGREIWFSSQMIFILFFFFLCIYTGDQYSF